MKIYTKILVTTLPIVFFFLIATVGISYYFSRNALTELAEEWLSTRSSEALEIVKKQESILHRYGLENIPASIIKAKLDAIKEISSIEIGKEGYLLGVDTHGAIIFHPNKNLMGMDVSTKKWFQQLKKGKGRIFFTLEDEKNIGIYNFFPEWDWFLLAVDPEKEVYGMANRMKPYTLSLGVIAAMIISFVLMLLSQRLIQPLLSLVTGAERIGNGDLETKISIKTQDEFADLAREFNQMTSRLKKSHEELEQQVTLRTKELILSNQTLINEIQERKIKESELKKAHLVKNEFLANVSHEIRTPLNSVIGFSELLSTMITGKEEASYLKAIQVAGNNLLFLINDILDLSKMEADKLELNRVIVDINVLFNDIYQLFESRIKEKPIKFIRQLDDQIPSTLLMDDIRLQQVMVNLLDNAIKFTNNGYVKLTTKKIKSYRPTHNLKVTRKIDLAVSIEDTGIGIPEDKLDSIFDSFHQASSHISKKYGGTGLGLSISKHLVELMGGRIQVESTEGKGTVFNLFLPEIEISQSKAAIQNISSNTMDTGPEPENPKDMISTEILKKYCAENNVLKNRIHSHIFQLIPEFQEGIKIKDVQHIIDNIISIGEKFHLPELTEFGRELSEHVQSFDIEKLDINLKKLYNVLKSIYLD